MNFADLQGRLVPLVAELLATLATRNPLRMYFADIAGKTLLDIVQVLRAEGISQEAIAASLGLTLNGYAAKMKRLREDHTVADEEEPRTLMERVYAYVAEAGDAPSPTRNDIIDHFRGVKPDSLKGVLHFLVRSELLASKGRGPSTRYRAVERAPSAGPNEHDASVLLYREGPLSADELARRLGCSAERVEFFLDRLRVGGDLKEIPGAPPRYRATDYHVPLDTAEGYEAAIYDHVAAVVYGLCKKLRLGRHSASLGDLIGGATFTFRVPVDDPLHDEVAAFLRDNRVKLESWLTRARAITQEGLEGREVRRFTLYVGQSVDDVDEG